MGNSTSNANTQPDPKSPASPRYASPARRASSQSPAPTANANGSNANSAPRVHRSLRHKKKSLELPDLASLALTPALGSPSSSGAYRRPRASSPIPIPTSPHPPPPTFRVQNNLPSAAHIAGAGRRYAGKDRSYLSSGFPSAPSFARAGAGGDGDGDEGDDHDRDHSQDQDRDRDRDGEDASPGRLADERRAFVPEVVHSTIPLALVKADGERPEHVAVAIKWRGGGKSVVLARAGDDYWKGRQPMEYE